MSNTIARAAVDAVINLNNAALNAPESTWQDVQAVCRDLEALADDQNVSRRSIRALGIAVLGR